MDLIKHRGYFITFEGIDGSGKSTQVIHLATFIKSEWGITPLIVREPGHDALNEHVIRPVLLRKDPRVSKMTELFLFLAARAQNMENHIIPHLDKGGIVIADRFMDSTYAYQGVGRGHDKDLINVMNDAVVPPDYRPNLTFILLLDPKEGLKRSHVKLSERSLNESKFEDLGLEFQKKVDRGYRSIAGSSMDRRFATINTNGKTVAEVHNLIVSLLIQRRGHHLEALRSSASV